MARKKTFKEKLADSKDFPRVEKISGGMIKKWGEGTIVIPAPWEVDELMKKVPKGKLITINQIRVALATRHKATISCPIVTGIHARIAAGAAGEDQEQGKKRVTPFWRTLKGDGEVNPKYPGGLDEQCARLQKEGHTVIKKGRRFVVQDYEKALVKI